MENTANPDSAGVVIVGGGPAGLMAAEVISNAGFRVDLYDAMPSVGRKFLLAGKGGLNLTHSEPYSDFVSRYGSRGSLLEPSLSYFGAEAVRAWSDTLGIATFIGSSGRVFPTDMKAAPLLRTWLRRLRANNVHFHLRHRLINWDDQGIHFETPDGNRAVKSGACVLALGGGSWARLGSDGKWVAILRQHAISVAPLQSSNCGFERPWSEHFRHNFAGQPINNVVATVADNDGKKHKKQGQFVITETGVEGSLIYALSAHLREAVLITGHAILELDLMPGKSFERILAEVCVPRAARSWSSHLQGKVGLDKNKINLLRELLSKEQMSDAQSLAQAIKSLQLSLHATRPIDEAISSAGGVEFSALDDNFMLRQCPGYFCAGEMLDWEAPTGGYLLTACFATGVRAGNGVLGWLKNRS